MTNDPSNDDLYKYLLNRPIDLKRFTIEAYRNIRADNTEDRKFGVNCLGVLLVLDANQQDLAFKPQTRAQAALNKQKLTHCASKDNDPGVRATAQRVLRALRDDLYQYLSDRPTDLQRFTEEASSNIASPNPRDRQYGVSCFGALFLLETNHEQGQTIKRQPETEPAKLKEKINLCAAQDRDPNVSRTAQRVLYDLNQMRHNPNRPDPNISGLAPRPQLRPL